MLGRSDPELKTSCNVLNRLISVDEDGWKIEVDLRHAELLIESWASRQERVYQFQELMTKKMNLKYQVMFLTINILLKSTEKMF